MKTYYRLILEAVAIIGSVLFSFYIEDLRKKSDNLILKNALIVDLIETIDDDLEQLKNIQDILFKSEQSILDILNDIDKTKGTEILKSTLDDIVDPKLVSIGRHRQYLKDWDVKIFSDGSREIIATPQEIEEAAKEFEVGKQKRALQNTIRKSMSGEEARQLLQSINQGNLPSSVAGFDIVVTDSVAETAAEVTDSVAELSLIHISEPTRPY